jgi:hypothetical protein
MTLVMINIVYKGRRLFNTFSEPSYQNGRDNYYRFLSNKQESIQIHLMNLSCEFKITKSKCLVLNLTNKLKGLCDQGNIMQ